MRRMMFVLGMGFLLAPSDFAQAPVRPPGDEPQSIFYEAVNLFASDSSLSRVDVHYRIDENFFVALRNTEPSFQWQFKRRGEVLIELLDSTGVSAARDIKRIELGTDAAETQDSEATWYQRIVSFNVHPGLYTIAIEISDLESERKFLDRSKTINAEKFVAGTLAISTPILAFPVEDNDLESQHDLTPQNFGGNALFGSGGSLVIEVLAQSPQQQQAVVRYSIKEQKPQDENLADSSGETVVSGSLVYQAELKVDSQLTKYSLAPDAGRSGSYVVRWQLPLQQLPLRRFELTAWIQIGGDSVKTTKSFRTVWPNMPRSLRNVDIALDALRFITRKDQLDSLKEGRFENRLKNLEGFWKEKDKTPGTAYNEVMAEYYRRVDYAMSSFGTLKEPDGSKYDRGRVYILYGPPTKTERSLNTSAGYQEVWTYENLKKKFIFADETKSGSYVLVSTQHL